MSALANKSESSTKRMCEMVGPLLKSNPLKELDFSVARNRAENPSEHKINK